LELDGLAEVAALDDRGGHDLPFAGISVATLINVAELVRVPLGGPPGVAPRNSHESRYAPVSQSRPAGGTYGYNFSRIESGAANSQAARAWDGSAAPSNAVRNELKIASTVSTRC